MLSLETRVVADSERVSSDFALLEALLDVADISVAIVETVFVSFSVIPTTHIFSVFVIGTTFMVLAVNDASPAGVAIAAVMMVMGLLQAVLRVIGGVHFIRDVIVGALIGILAGIVGVIFIISP